MPELCRFFGIIIRMHFTDHDPPHLHAEYQGYLMAIDFKGNILIGDLHSRTALRLLRDWVDLHSEELKECWDLARAGLPTKKISPPD